MPRLLRRLVKGIAPPSYRIAGPALGGRGARYTPQMEPVLIETFQLCLEPFCSQRTIRLLQECRNFWIVPDLAGDYDVLTR